LPAAGKGVLLKRCTTAFKEGSLPNNQLNIATYPGKNDA
jgi:hypothetical protein